MLRDPFLWPVLEAASREDLEPLVQLLKDKSVAWSPDEAWSIDELKCRLHDELLAHGGNSFANLARGAGRPWADIVRDAAKKENVEFSASDSAAKVEEQLLCSVVDQAIDGMPQIERENLLNGLQQAGLPTGPGLGVLLYTLRRAGFAPYKTSVVVANKVMKALVGRGMSFMANATLAKAISITLGPLGWAVSTIWTAIDLAGPAYRITIPASILIAVLRAQQRQSTHA